MNRGVCRLIPWTGVHGAMLAGLSFLVSYFFGTHSFTVAFGAVTIAGACVYAPYGPFFSLIPERLPRNRTGEVIAMVNGWGALVGVNPRMNSMAELVPQDLGAAS